MQEAEKLELEEQLRNLESMLDSERATNGDLLATAAAENAALQDANARDSEHAEQQLEEVGQVQNFLHHGHQQDQRKAKRNLAHG